MKKIQPFRSEYFSSDNNIIGMKMTAHSWRAAPRWVLLKSVFLFSLHLSMTYAASPKDGQDHAVIIQDMIKWVRSMGGFVHDKLEFRRRDPTSTDFSPLGVFTTEAISKNERLFQIPKESYISVVSPQEDQEASDVIYSRANATTDEIMTAYYANTCQLAHRIKDELHVYRTNPEASKYRSFVAYLNTVPRGQLPATYTQEAKAILRDLLGTVGESNKSRDDPYILDVMTKERYGTYALPPYQLVDWIDLHFRSNSNDGGGACIAYSDKEGEHAVAMAIQRGFDFELIPVWDMCNHDNGKLNTATNSIRNGSHVQVWADQDIAAGDELFGTYNYCEDCYDIGDEWGTPGIFRDFGFVEDYPQVWPFLDHRIYFEVGYFHEDGNAGGGEGDDRQIEARFWTDQTTGELTHVPDKDGLAFLQSQLDRLMILNIGKVKENQRILPHESIMILQYHQALTVALKAGIEATLALNQNSYPGNDEL